MWQVILFSDILTPLSGMNIPFDIVKGKGPIIFDPIREASDVEPVREFVPEESVPYVGEALTTLRKEVCPTVFSFWFYSTVIFFILLTTTKAYNSMILSIYNLTKERIRITSQIVPRSRRNSLVLIITINVYPKYKNNKANVLHYYFVSYCFDVFTKLSSESLE